MKIGFILVILALLPPSLLWSSSFAQSSPRACLQGSSENSQFINALSGSSAGRNSLLGAFQAASAPEDGKGPFWKGLGRDPISFLKDTHASHENCAMGKNSMSNYQQILHAIAIPKISKQCIRASIQRDVSGGNNYCASDSGPAKTYTNVATGQCINDEVVSYYQWAIQQAYACLAYESAGPLDMKLILKIFNNESAFAAFQNSSRGLGLGQLTTNAISDLPAERQPAVFRRILSSTRKECTPFKTALRAGQPTKKSNICLFQNPNNGIARQLIYSMGYMLRIRDGLMNLPKELSAIGIEDIRYANLILAVKYSSEAKIASQLLQHLKNNPKESFEKFNAYVEKNTNYATDIKSTFQDMQNIDPSIKSAADCIQY